METSTILAIMSMLLTVASMIWIGGFRFSAIVHEVKTLKSDMNKLENKLDKRIDDLEGRMDKRFEKMELRFEKFENRMEILQTEFYKMDIRLTTLEQRKL